MKIVDIIKSKKKLLSCLSWTTEVSPTFMVSPIQLRHVTSELSPTFPGREGWQSYVSQTLHWAKQGQQTNSKSIPKRQNKTNTPDKVLIKVEYLLCCRLMLSLPVQLGLRTYGRSAQRPQPRHDADLCSTESKERWYYLAVISRHNGFINKFRH